MADSRNEAASRSMMGAGALAASARNFEDGQFDRPGALVREVFASAPSEAWDSAEAMQG